MTRRLIKDWEFLADRRPDVTLAGGTRLSNDVPTDPAIELVLTGGFYPDPATQSTVLSWTYEPHGLQKFLMFQEEADKPAGTAITYRLVSGGIDTWWTGSAWATATGPTDWSTAAEISANMPTFPIASRQVAVKARLQASTDRKSTPRLRAVKFLGNFVVEWLDDLIYDTVVRSLQDTLQSTTDIQFAVVTTATSFDLSSADYRLDNPGYNFVDVASVFNLTADPDRFTNLAVSYTPGPIDPKDGTLKPGIVTVSGPVSAGDVLRVSMKIKPEIAVKTDQDYYEVERLPAVAIERVENVRLLDGSEREANAGGDGDVIYDATSGAAVRVPPPRQANYRFSWAIFAKTQSELQRLTGAMEEWVANHPFLRTWALDEVVGVDPDQADMPTGETNDEVRTSSGAFMLRIVPSYLLPAEDGYVILNLNMAFVLN